jgi:uncharacterized protein YwqG
MNQIINHDENRTKESIKFTFDTCGLGKHWQKFEPKLREEIRITTIVQEESEMLIGQSKIGGRPDLPAKMDWLREGNGNSLSFIAQINFGELKEYNKTSELPNSGIIYFFYSAEQKGWGFDPMDKDKFKVFYSDNNDNLIRKEFPFDLDEYSKYKPCKLTFANSVSLPGWENEFVQENLKDKEIDAYIEIMGVEMCNKMLGYSDNIQGEMELECQLVTNGLFCGNATGFDDSKRIELEKGADDWRLLLQIDSEDDKTGMMWGDAGRLYYWIKEQDLKNLDFEKAWFILQCY